MCYVLMYCIECKLRNRNNEQETKQLFHTGIDN